MVGDWQDGRVLNSTSLYVVYWDCFWEDLSLESSDCKQRINYFNPNALNVLYICIYHTGFTNTLGVLSSQQNMHSKMIFFSFDNVKKEKKPATKFQHISRQPSIV